MSYVEDMHGWMRSSGAPEVRLPDSPPLAFTRNFLWVVLACVGLLATVPLFIGWLASLFLR